MASQNSLRQASRTLRSSRLRVASSRLQISSRSPLSSTALTSSYRSHPLRATSIHLLHQSRSFSLWGSSSSAKAAEATSQTPQPNVTIAEPPSLEAIRTVRADNTSSALDSHPPNAIEPAFLESAQNTLLEPHGSAIDPAPPLEDIPERLGYLYEVCGIDFGYGPSSMMQWTLEHIHIVGGLSWTASIIVLGLALRSTMFPFIVKSAEQAAILRIAQKLMKPMQDEYKEASREKDSVRMQKAMTQIRAITREAGVKYRWMFAPMLIQIPFGFGAWRTLRNCATLPVPGFVTESWLWTTDLTFSDPYFIVPAISSGLIYLTMRLNASMNTRGVSGGTAALANMDMMALLQKILPGLSFVFISFQPGAVQLYFASSSAMGLLSALIMRWPTARKLMGVPPLGGDQEAAARLEAKFGSPTTSSSSNSSTNQPQPGFMKMSRRSGSVIDAKSRIVPTESETPSAEEEQKDISSIDRGVNKVKTFGSELKKNWTGAIGKAWSSAEERQEAQRQQKREEYEDRIRRQLDERRRERNAVIGRKRQ